MSALRYRTIEGSEVPRLQKLGKRANGSINFFAARIELRGGQFGTHVFHTAPNFGGDGREATATQTLEGRKGGASVFWKLTYPLSSARMLASVERSCRGDGLAATLGPE